MTIPELSNQFLTQWLIHFLLLIPASILVTRIYYMSKDRTSGFILGIFFLITGIILDLLLTIHIVKGGFEIYFSNPFLWISFIEMIFVVWVTEVASV